jgi:hypothetical protein
MNPGPVVWVQIGLQKPHKRRPSLVVLNRERGAPQCPTDSPRMSSPNYS